MGFFWAYLPPSRLHYSASALEVTNEAPVRQALLAAATAMYPGTPGDETSPRNHHEWFHHREHDDR